MGRAIRLMCLCASLYLASAVITEEMSDESKLIMRREVSEETPKKSTGIEHGASPAKQSRQKRATPRKQSREKPGEESHEASSMMRRETKAKHNDQSHEKPKGQTHHKSLSKDNYHSAAKCAEAGKYVVNFVLPQDERPGVNVNICTQACAEKDPADAALGQEHCTDHDGKKGKHSGRWKHLDSNKMYKGYGMQCGACEERIVDGTALGLYLFAGHGFAFDYPDKHKPETFKVIPADYLDSKCKPHYEIKNDMCFGFCAPPGGKDDAFPAGYCHTDTSHTNFVGEMPLSMYMPWKTAPPVAEIELET